MASNPRGSEENERESSKRETETERGIPQAPLILAVIFPGCGERSLLVGVGSRASARGVRKLWSPL